MIPIEDLTDVILAIEDTDEDEEDKKDEEEDEYEQNEGNEGGPGCYGINVQTFNIWKKGKKNGARRISG